jgi:hypothetical protein
MLPSQYSPRVGSKMRQLRNVGCVMLRTRRSVSQEGDRDRIRVELYGAECQGQACAETRRAAMVTRVRASTARREFIAASPREADRETAAAELLQRMRRLAGVQTASQPDHVSSIGSSAPENPPPDTLPLPAFPPSPTAVRYGVVQPAVSCLKLSSADRRIPAAAPA